jgi:predicted lactoylglutathione lyase
MTTMANAQPVFDQVNLVVKDMEAALAFYRRLGLVIEALPELPPGSGARHAEATMPSGMRFELDNHEMARIWHPGWRDRGNAGRVLLNLSVPSREAVDELHARLTEAGHASRQPPYDTFWGSRFAIVEDPDGNEVGLMSPPDRARAFTPTPGSSG